MKPSAPVSATSFFIRSLSSLEQKMTLIDLNMSFFFTNRQNWPPSTLGMLMSSRMRSGRVWRFRMIEVAFSASGAYWISNPFASSSSRSRRATISESSTMSTRRREPSAAVSRSDYLLAKAAALLLVMGLIAVVPQLVLLAGNVLTADSAMTYLGDHLGDLPRILLAGGVLTGYYAVISL